MIPGKLLLELGNCGKRHTVQHLVVQISPELKGGWSFYRNVSFFLVFGRNTANIGNQGHVVSRAARAATAHEEEEVWKTPRFQLKIALAMAGYLEEAMGRPRIPPRIVHITKCN